MPVSHLIHSIDAARDLGRPLAQALYEALRAAVVSGDIAAGQRLPASRSLARELGLSRSTVVTAYEQLAAEGFVEGRRGAGVFVCAIGEVEVPDGAASLSAPRQERARKPVPGPWPDRREGADTRPDVLPLAPGQPDMALFPLRPWARCLGRVARFEPDALVMPTDPFGDPRLRAAVAAHLAQWRGMRVRAQNIVITAGSLEALELCLRALACPGDGIAVEDPCYPPVRDYLDMLGMGRLDLAVDDQGARVPSSSEDPILTVLTPSHQFPLGGAMPMARRRAFLNWAVERGGQRWIIEDDYDSEFRFGGRPIAAMQSIDAVGRVIYVGSFSKIFSSALRLGYAVLPDALVPAMEDLLGRYGTRASIAVQRPLAVFMEEGGFHRHLRRVRRIYGERRKALLHALGRYLPGRIRFVDHQAGMQIAVRVTGITDDRVLVEALRRAGVEAQPISRYSASDDAFGNTPGNVGGLLLGFCGFEPTAIDAAVRRLAEVIERL
ncbi:MAG: PLP-dependent aminotransferase family protein [Gammaproteobacteria bacterium]